MIRSLLILMLIATQLLTGSRVSAYLCVSNDGLCRIDSGSASCTSCRDACNATRQSSELFAACRDEVQQCTSHREAASRGVQNQITKSCGCFHVPILVASEQPAHSLQGRAVVDVELQLSTIAPAVVSPTGCASVLQSRVTSSDTSAAVAYSLIVVSTVVMRC